jgi:hypothetical protein
VDDPPLHGVIAILMAAFGALYALAIAAIIVASAN